MSKFDAICTRFAISALLLTKMFHVSNRFNREEMNFYAEDHEVIYILFFENKIFTYRVKKEKKCIIGSRFSILKNCPFIPVQRLEFQGTEIWIFKEKIHNLQGMRNVENFSFIFTKWRCLTFCMKEISIRIFFISKKVKKTLCHRSWIFSKQIVIKTCEFLHD